MRRFAETIFISKKVPSLLTNRAFIVGGAVRDFLLGLEPSDIDFVVLGSSDAEMLRLGMKKVGADFPVYLYNKCEYALGRTERKNGSGYNGFQVKTFNVTLEMDLERRDLTINAMAIAFGGKLIDPYNGLSDLENKVLRHTSDAFAEDPLRVLRVARFMARYTDFSISDETLTLMKSLKSEMSTLVPERVFKETVKALSEKQPSRFFRTLLEADVLDIIYPELFAMVGCKQNKRHHAEGDVFEHTMRVLDEACKLSSDPEVRFAALFHDIGKPLVGVFNEETKFFGHSKIEIVEKAIIAMKKRLKIPNSYATLAILVAKIHHKIYDLQKMNVSGVKKLVLNDLPTNIDILNKMIIAVKADELGRICCDNEETILSDKDIDILFNGGEVKDCYHPGSHIKESFIRVLFDIKIMKSEVGKIIPDASVNAKHNFISHELDRRIKTAMSKYDIAG